MGSSAPKLTPEEEARQNKRVIDRAARTVERERVKLQGVEKKTLAEIKTLAKQNKHGPAKILMKDLVRTRHQIDMYYSMASQLKAMGLQLGTIKATASISSALKSATTTMTHVNQSMSIKDIQGIIKEFTRQQAKMEANQDVMNDAIEMGMDGYGTEGDIDKAYQEVCEEVGIEISEEVAGAGSQKLGGKAKTGVDDLEARLDQLK